MGHSIPTQSILPYIPLLAFLFPFSDEMIYEDLPASVYLRNDRQSA